MKVGIIGGGWAGLAAAVTLAQNHIPFTLYESAVQLGGRARRVTVHDLDVDNGQHILIGAYHSTLNLLETVGIDVATSGFQPPLTLRVEPGFSLRAAPLPAPLHLGIGLLTSRGLSGSDKRRAIQFLFTLKRLGFRLSHDISVTQLLDQHRQTLALHDNLWLPLCLAALNTPPDQASAQVFINVLRDAFFGTHSDSTLIVPKVDLGALLPDAAATWIKRHGGEIKLGQRILRVDRADQGYTLHHAEGETGFTHVICAAPWFRVSDLLGHIPELENALHAVRAMTPQPIYTVYLQYDAKTQLPFPMLGMRGTTSQWVFDRGVLCGQANLLSIVISAAGGHETLSHDALAHHVALELQKGFGFSALPQWTQVIAEKRATFACTPGLARPAQRTPLPGLYLAGDYTASDYPATLEAAVQSGIQCALSLLEPA